MWYSMGEWKEYRLSEIIEIYGGGTPDTKVREYWDGEIPWLSVTDFNNGMKYCYNAEKSITELGLKNSSTKILRKGQVIISARGTVGVISMLGRDMAFNQSCYGINGKTEKTFNDFLYYLLKYKVPEFISNAYGAVFDTITKNTFEQIIVKLPPLEEQKEIAEILSSLDDKIDLLHRQNKTLEEMAQILFRQWFIEEAQDDWEEVELTKICDFLNGIALQKYPPKNLAKLPVIKIREMKNSISENTDYCSADIPQKYIVENGDVLFSWSGSLEVVLWYNGNGALNQHIYKVTSEKFPKWFYYLVLKYHLNNFRQIAESKTTTMGHIQREHLENITISLPRLSKELINNNFFNDIFSLFEIKTFQIKVLQTLQNDLNKRFLSKVDDNS